MRTRSIIPALLAVALAAGSASACSVPVFRYALERWPAEPYLVYVFHKGPLAGDDAKIVEWIRACAGDASVPTNAEVWDVDIDASSDADSLAVWKRQSNLSPSLGASATLPWVVVRYPAVYSERRPGDLWAGPLTAANAKAAFDSPARREVGKRILSGDAIVWVLLESGDRKADDAAEATLKAEVDKLKKSLQLPELLEEDLQEGAVKPDLTVSLSYLRIARSDAAETFFVRMLQESEPDLPADKPIVFTILGQGRLLCALTGAGINAANLDEIGQYAVGPCSCVVKEQNPGTDLLMSVNWSALPDGKWVKPQEMPPLTGLSALAEAAPVKSAPAPRESPAASRGPFGTLTYAVVAAVALILFAIVIATAILRRRTDSGT